MASGLPNGENEQQRQERAQECPSDPSEERFAPRPEEQGEEYCASSPDEGPRQCG